MTDLSGKILGKTTEEIAYYFSANKEDVQASIDGGAKTYQDVYCYLEKLKQGDGG